MDVIGHQVSGLSTTFQGWLHLPSSNWKVHGSYFASFRLSDPKPFAAGQRCSLLSCFRMPNLTCSDCDRRAISFDIPRKDSAMLDMHSRMAAWPEDNLSSGRWLATRLQPQLLVPWLPHALPAFRIDERWKNWDRGYYQTAQKDDGLSCPCSWFAWPHLPNLSMVHWIGGWYHSPEWGHHIAYLQYSVPLCHLPFYRWNR